MEGLSLHVHNMERAGGEHVACPFGCSLTSYLTTLKFRRSSACLFIDDTLSRSRGFAATVIITARRTCHITLDRLIRSTDLHSHQRSPHILMYNSTHHDTLKTCASPHCTHAPTPRRGIPPGLTNKSSCSNINTRHPRCNVFEAGTKPTEHIMSTIHW